MMTFDKKEYKESFKKFRKMPLDIYLMYFSHFKEKSLQNSIFFDVGAGPGFQTKLFLENSSSKGKAIVLEPSVELMNEAVTYLKEYNHQICYFNCNLSEVSISLKPDIVWMSEVVHLLGSPNLWIEVLSKIINDTGKVIIRTSTHNQLENRKWYDFFSNALEIDKERHPGKKELIDAFQINGFEIETYTIDESKEIESTFFIEMFENKSFSTLHELSNDDFEKGLTLIKDYVNTQKTVHWDYEMTAYVATKIGDYE